MNELRRLVTVSPLLGALLICVVAACSQGPSRASDTDASQDVDTAVDTRGDGFDPDTRLPDRPRLTLPGDAVFVDAHMHCGLLDESGCTVGATWEAISEAGGYGVILSTEHFTFNYNDDIEAFYAALGVTVAPDRQNEIYGQTAAARPELWTFTSLECWHDTPLGDGWVEACKNDARQALERGAIGFKDHVGKQWQSDADGPAVADSGIFSGGLTRLAGGCTDVPNSLTANRECVQLPGVIYPLLTSEWREVVRYITEDLKAPIVSHATTYYGAEASCWDPLTSQLASCAPMSRLHLLEFAAWAASHLSAEARRRFIVGHSGFMVPGERLLPRDSDSPEQAAERERIATELLSQLNAVLSAGLSVESSVTNDLVAMTYRQQSNALGACTIRELFATYPDQIVFGTDRRVDNGDCLTETYALWDDLLRLGVHELGRVRTACSGPAATYGLDLDAPVITECAGSVPADILDRFLKRNFARLYL